MLEPRDGRATTFYSFVCSICTSGAVNGSFPRVLLSNGNYITRSCSEESESTCSQGQNTFVYLQFILTGHLSGHAAILGRLSGHIESLPIYSTIGVLD
jgi:hypothetical protein